MRIDPATDYALPMMRIEKMLRDLHNLLLKKKYDDSLELSTKITAESRLLTQTLKLMDEHK